MAIVIQCSNPAGLLADLRRGISQGTIRTWEETEKDLFTHTPKQWNREAWFTPKILRDGIAFGILKRKDRDLTREIYGIYHGRFTEELIIHLSRYFDHTGVSSELDSDYDGPSKLV